MSNNETTPPQIDLDGLYKTRRDALAMCEMILERIEKTQWMVEAVKAAGLTIHDLYEVVKVGSKWRVKASAKHLAATRGEYKEMGYGIR